MRWESEPMRVLNWEACLNVRDVGGYPAKDGRQTRLGALVRADGLHQLTAAGRAALLDYGVRTIIDLRFRDEIEQRPNPFARPEERNGHVKYLNLPPVDSTDKNVDEAMNRAPSVLARYRLALDFGQARIAKIATAIADAPEGCVLVHCHAGKDRTGRLVALLLGLVGVPDQTIADDYALTDVYLRPLYEEILKIEPDPKEREAFTRQIVEAPEMMLQVLSYVDKQYGGAEGYLSGGGVTEEKLEWLRGRLLEPVSKTNSF
jgi:protein-tyrosine phosphatase